jgi:ketosteroid isomerase-like protein
MDPRAIIAQLRDEFARAFNREDLTRLAQLCADDVILIPPSQPPIVGVSAAVEWWRIGFTVSRTRLELQPREMLVAREGVLEWCEWSVSMVPLAGGAPLIDFGHLFWVWRCDADGRWRIARELWNSSSEIPSLWAGGWASSPVDGFPTLM